jgi:hypothetical protein
LPPAKLTSSGGIRRDRGVRAEAGAELLTERRRELLGRPRRRRAPDRPARAAYEFPVALPLRRGDLPSPDRDLNEEEYAGLLFRSPCACRRHRGQRAFPLARGLDPDQDGGGRQACR